MAEATAFRNNALPYPVYGVAWTVVFTLLDADGDPVTGAASLDSERSLNGDTFADCTNEATEIATSSGVYYLTLTAAEMTADIVAVQIKATGVKTTIIVLYPRKLAILSTGTCQGSNDTGDIQLAAGDSAIDDIYNGCLCVAVIDGTTEARIINDYVGSTKVGEVSPAWNTAQPDSSDTYTIYQPEGRSVGGANILGWMGTAPAAYSATRGTAGTALPAAAADAAGGLIVSDAGGLDADAQLVTKINDILTDTAEIGAAGAGLTNINLPDQSMNITGNITGNLSGSVGSVTGNVGGNLAGSVASVTGNVGGDLIGNVNGGVAGNVVGSVGSLAAQAKADVNAEVDTALTDYDGPTNAELATALAAADDAVLAQVALVKAKTDNLPSDPADESLIIAATDAIMSRLGAPAGASVSADIAAVKVETAAILDDTGTSGVVVAAGSKTGYALSATGVDLVLVAGKTLPQAILYIGATAAGVISGAGTSTETFKDFAGNTAVTVTADADGNRSAIVYAP